MIRRVAPSLGMEIAGRGADNIVAARALAIEMDSVAEDLVLTLHPHPMLGETEAEAAEAFLGLATHIVLRRKGDVGSMCRHASDG